ncbi:MAG: HNH endonuclease, partial [Betaproteobacteria bacterium]|nr:HNH endonuclease [Betaproteobacteria bacterium]
MTDRSDLQLLRQLQRLLDEGQFSATYKYALLQALADLAVERPPDPDGGLRLPIAAIAEKFLEYYWRQALPFRAPQDKAPAAILRQNTGKQAAIIRELADTRQRHDGLIAAARADTQQWDELRRKTAKVVRVMPLWKLQVIGRKPVEFLYQKSEYRQRDDSIRLLPEAAAGLRQFHGLVTHLVRGAWVAQVRRIATNHKVLGATGSLADFLFGSDRAALDGFGTILRDHQSGRCFYCAGRVQGAGEVDHFVAWSRYPVDLGHNFVFACRTCNGAKRDYLAHPDHLRHWREQNLDHSDALAEQFAAACLPHDAGRSRQVAEWAYEQGEVGGAHVWRAGNKDVLPFERG